MNIFTVTFLHNNYGSILQAFALQSRLSEMGATPNVLLKSPRKRYPRFIVRLGELWYMIKYIIMPDRDYSINKRINLIIDDRKFKRKYEKLTYFINARLATIEVHNEEEFCANVKSQDIFLAGSDQIWNTVGRPLSAWYTFQWLSGKSNPKYSYAASIGHVDLTDSMRQDYKSALESFSTISLRESQAVDIFSNIFPGKVRQDLDPTLLYEGNFWRKIESPKLIDDPYVFVYRLRPNDDVFEYARKIAKEKHCKILYTGLYSYNDDNIRTIYDAGIEDFLSYIDHAEAVVTNSFHGTVFSVLFEKPFLSIKVATTGSRAESMLHLLGLDSQYIKDSDANYSLSIDYSRVKPLLEQERNKSLAYLKSICDSTYDC